MARPPATSGPTASRAAATSATHTTNATTGIAAEGALSRARRAVACTKAEAVTVSEFELEGDAAPQDQVDETPS